MSSSKPSDGLNPAMAFRPPPSTSPAPGSDTYLRIDESEDPKYRLRVHLAWIVRLCLAWMTFGPLLGLIIVGRLGGGRRHTIAIFYELLFVLVWQLFHLIPQLSALTRVASRRLPRMSLQIGDASCVLGGSDDHHMADRDYYSQPPKKNLASLITTVIDFSFGVTLITFGAIWTNSRCYWGYNCYAIGQHIPSIVLTIVLGCLMVIAAFFSLYKTYHTMAFEFSIYKDGTVQPISLGSHDADVSSRREAVSISA